MIETTTCQECQRLRENAKEGPLLLIECDDCRMARYETEIQTMMDAIEECKIKINNYETRMNFCMGKIEELKKRKEQHELSNR